MVFNVFIFMQVFNMLNSRKIDESFNFLEGLSKNMLFVGVWLFIFGIQILLGN